MAATEETEQEPPSHNELWDQIEAKYWTQQRELRANEDRQLQEAHDREYEKVRLRLFDGYKERIELLKQLKMCNERLDEDEGRLKQLQRDFERRKGEVAAARALDDEDKHIFFTYRGRNMPPDLSSKMAFPSAGQSTSVKDAAGPAPTAQSEPSVEPDRTVPPDSPLSDLTSQTPDLGASRLPSALPSRQATPSKDSQLAEVLDSSGNLIAHLRSPPFDNLSVSKALERPVQRAVRIRVGRRFDAEDLEHVYEPTDTKGSKWISCYIQAAGAVQGKPCQTCSRNIGPFQDCIIMDHEEFPRCGNCLWNRHACHGARAAEDAASAPAPDLAPASASTAAPGSGPTTAGDASAQLQIEPAGSPAFTSGFTAVNRGTTSVTQGPQQPEVKDKSKDLKTPARLPSGRKALPTERKASSQFATPGTSTPVTASEAEAPEAPDLPPINASNLALRHDGVVFTEPPIMRGVPLAKISPQHPYWENDWAPIETIVTPQLAKWKAKYEHHVSTGTSESSKYLANRQINRGNTILNFLREGELHPYQIIDKKWIDSKFCNYDTIYRLVQILEELNKFNLDITPSQWLRQRLQELELEHGDDFSLGKAVHGLYHDPKVAQLRAKNGFGNIGRPSGYKMEKGQESTPRKGFRPLKRKDPHSTPKGTPVLATAPAPAPAPAAVEETGAAERVETPAAAEVPTASRPPTPDPAAQTAARPVRPRSGKSETGAGGAGDGRPPEPPQAEQDSKPKRQRIILKQGSVDEDLEYSGYTSTDSFSNLRLEDIDWRVSQVKHRHTTSSTQVTQYWHWLGKEDSQQEMFEHQVLKEPSNEGLWGVYKEPIDFHLRLSEMEEVTYSRDGLQIMVVNKEVASKKKGKTAAEDRGNVFAQFKRERTKRRFLKFIREKGVRVVKTTKEHIQAEWDTIPNNMLSGGDEDSE